MPRTPGAPKLGVGIAGGLLCAEPLGAVTDPHGVCSRLLASKLRVTPGLANVGRDQAEPIGVEAAPPRGLPKLTGVLDLQPRGLEVELRGPFVHRRLVIVHRGASLVPGLPGEFGVLSGGCSAPGGLPGAALSHPAALVRPR